LTKVDWIFAQIDGTFRLNKPPVLLGYQHESKSRKQTNAMGEEQIEMGIGTSEETFLTMFVTIEPALTPAEPAKEKVGLLKSFCSMSSGLRSSV
jgi:coiled-coil and C2 domain-containing protein 2A